MASTTVDIETDETDAVIMELIPENEMTQKMLEPEGSEEDKSTANSNLTDNADPEEKKDSDLVKVVENPEDEGKKAEIDSEEKKATQEDSDDGKKSEEEGDEGVKCGFLVDRICTMPYQKAVQRGEVPFCAFAPISTQDLYLLRIQDCADTTRHMLVPASKEEVFSTPGALKSMDDDQEPGNEESMNYRVAIVAIARQIYSEEDKQLVVSVDPPTKKDKKRIQVVKFLTLDKFADFAFLGFDGNVSEFANANNNNESANKDGNAVGELNQTQQNSLDGNATVSTPALPVTVKSPPKAPTRRGRGGRRRMGRKSPVSSSPRHAMLGHPHQPPPSQYFSTSFQLYPPLPMSNELSTDYTQASIKMEHGHCESDNHNYISQGYHHFPIPMSQVPVTDPSLYTQDQFIMSSDVPMPMLQVPTPVSEVTISTTEPGAEAGAQQTTHDLITIAFDQLVGMSSEVSGTEVIVSEKSTRGGRRAGPGRKPGRKPLKDRHPNQIDIMDENAMFGHHGSDDIIPVAAPKRRGRPPKNRVQPQLPSVENESSNSGMEGIEHREDFENYEKRMKFQIMES